MRTRRRKADTPELRVVPKRKPRSAAAAAAKAIRKEAEAPEPSDSEASGDDEDVSPDDDGEVYDADLRDVWKRRKKSIPPPPPPSIPNPAEFTLVHVPNTRGLRPQETCALRYYQKREYSLLKTLLRTWLLTGYSPDFALSDGLMCHPQSEMSTQDYDAFYSLFVYVTRPLVSTELQYLSASYLMMNQAFLNGTRISFCSSPVCTTTTTGVNEETAALTHEFVVTYVVTYFINERRRAVGFYLMPELYTELCRANPAWTAELGARSTIILTLIYGYWVVPYIETISDLRQLRETQHPDIVGLVENLPLSAFPVQMLV